MSRLANGPNDPSYPHVQRPALGDKLVHQPSDCRLFRPGHLVRPINAWHRCEPRAVRVTAPPPHDRFLPVFQQVFLIADRSGRGNEDAGEPVAFVVHNPAQLREWLEKVDGCAIYGRAHNALWMNGLSCNTGFSPCFSEPYPCSLDTGRDDGSSTSPYVDRHDSVFSTADMRVAPHNRVALDWWEDLPDDRGMQGALARRTER